MRTRPFISIFVFFVAACLNLRRQSTGQENERQRDEEEDRQHAKGVGDCGGAILVVVGAVRVGACLEPGAKHRFVTPKVKPFYYFIVIVLFTDRRVSTRRQEGGIEQESKK